MATDRPFIAGVGVGEGAVEGVGAEAPELRHSFLWLFQSDCWHSREQYFVTVHFAQRLRSLPESDFSLPHLAHFGGMGLAVASAMMLDMCPK
jgi:hypothetical protein